ncbi:DNA replication/repair protein RecF [Idiomarina abyssalis]|uniref:DNA replication/repair protein RecF n=1 Tax=Idiomarina abyssalis TaxID=86102 RepID=UPI003A91E67A
MFIETLSLSHFRNFSEVALSPSPQINLITGDNGSGKTSLLEAIYLLGFGRSFRSGGFRQLIKEGNSGFTVFCRSKDYSIGVRRSGDGEQSLRLNGANVQRMSDVARLVPVQLLTPESVDILLEGPGQRRQFIDWGVFHVEHSFYSDWVAYTQLLKQRNSLLKQRSLPVREDKYWKEQLAYYGERISKSREKYLEELNDYIQELAKSFLSDVTMEVRLKSGWDTSQSLFDALESHTEKDKKYGFTSVGAHKADIKVIADGVEVKHRLSRGQLKTAITALKLAQGKHYQKIKKQPCIYLVDDLTSELDSRNQALLCRELENLDAQVFITAITGKQLSDKFQKSPRMFHVEHGVINE